MSKFRTLVADPNPPNGGNPPGGIVDQNNKIGTNVCQQQTNTPDTIKMTFCGGLTTAEQTSITATLNTFKTEDCASKFLYAYFANKTFGFCITSGSYNVNYNPQTNTFTFSTDEAATPTFANLLEHEFFHAFQNADYPGGISGYGKNSTTGQNGAGFVNIEFEQAVFNDIVTHNSNAFVNGTPGQRQNYTNWLNQLTNNGTTYPKLSPSSSTYTQFINNYNSFLQQYNTLPDNENSSAVINLTPKAFIDLFNAVNPNC